MGIEGPNLTKEQPKMEQTMQTIEVFVNRNSQLIEGKLRYVISGSTAVVLFAEAENIKMYTVDTEGNLAQVEEKTTNEKTRLYLKENLIKFGTPSDIDISFTESNFPEKSLIDDEFLLQDGERIMSGNVGGKEYYFESPEDYIVKIFANNYADAAFGGDSRANKRYTKLVKMEVALEAVLQDVSSSDLAEEIEKKIQQILRIQEAVAPRPFQKKITEENLSDPQKMYARLASAVLRTTEGDHSLSVNINRFPRVREFIRMMSTRIKI